MALSLAISIARCWSKHRPTVTLRTVAKMSADQLPIRSEPDNRIPNELKRDRPLLNAFREHMREAVVPLFTNWDGPPHFIGTGVLLSFNDMVFILTAAHVLEEFDGYALHLPVGTEIIGVKGYSYRTPKPASGSHRDDPIDAAVFYIDEGPLRDTLKKAALTIDDLYMTDELFPRGVVMLGHPARSFKRWGKALDTELSWVHLYGVEENTYERLGFSREDHLLLRYSKRVMTMSGTGNAPSLRGMSGCGVWVVPQLMRHPWPTGTLLMRPRLIGIFIETREKDRVYVVTRIFHHLMRIGNAHPELSALFNQELERAETDDAFRESEAFRLRSELSINLDYVMHPDLIDWMVLDKPSGIIMRVSRNRVSSRLEAYNCEICLQPERLQITSRELERIKSKAILRVAERESQK